MLNSLNQTLRWSFLLFGFAALAFLVTGVLLDSTLAAVPNSIQRAMTIVLIVLPALAGAVFGVFSFTQTPRRVLLSLLSVLLNGLTALFFFFLASFAG